MVQGKKKKKKIQEFLWTKKILSSGFTLFIISLGPSNDYFPVV